MKKKKILCPIYTTPGYRVINERLHKMSTILKALKQAEKQSPDQGDENQPSFTVHTTLRSRIQQQKKSSFFKSVRVEILVVLFIVMATFSYFLFSINKNIQPQTPYTGNQSPVLDTQPDIVPDIVKGQKQTVSKSITKPSSLQEASIEILPESAAESFDLSNPPNKTVLKPEPARQVPATKNPTRDEKGLLHKDTSKPELPSLKNDSLRVQAISWADEPASRVTVINNRILQEGDSFQGYRLVIIEKDSVILHYSGSDYRLEFKHR